MLFEIPPEMLENFPTQGTGWNLYLWIAYVAELLILAFICLFINKPRHDFENLRKAENGYAGFGVLYAIGRALFIIQMKYQDGAYYDDICSWAYLVSMAGFTWMIYGLEKYKLQRKSPVFTAVGIIGIVVSFLSVNFGETQVGDFRLSNLKLFERYFVLQAITVFSTFMMMVVLYLYLKIIQDSLGRLEKMARLGLTALVIMILGIFLDGQMVVSNPRVILEIKFWMAPICANLGILLFIYSRYEPKRT
jgi:hypothetical protein